MVNLFVIKMCAYMDRSQAVKQKVCGCLVSFIKISIEGERKQKDNCCI